MPANSFDFDYKLFAGRFCGGGKHNAKSLGRLLDFVSNNKTRLIKPHNIARYYDKTRLIGRTKIYEVIMSELNQFYRKIKKTLLNHHHFTIALLVCLTCICFAFFVEKFLGKRPCNLCLVERWFLYGFVGVFLLHFYHLRFANILSLLNFGGGAGVSLYHILLESKGPRNSHLSFQVWRVFGSVGECRCCWR